MRLKKFIAVILAVLLLFSAVGFVAVASNDEVLSLSAGIEALRRQFKKGIGPTTNDIAIDYRYFTPVGSNDDTKYPLVIWFHGMGDGEYEGDQIDSNDIAYWTSAEFQSRFSGSNGAYVLALRSPEEDGLLWDTETISPTRAAIDDFISNNIDNIDVKRIYVGGYSMGGKMTVQMLTAYPDMFAAAFPICPFAVISESEAAAFRNVPVWLTSGALDTTVNYAALILPSWNNIKANNNRLSDCRFSTLSTVCYPNGSSAISQHRSWYAVTYDMFSTSNGSYPNMKTVNGFEEELYLTYPNGMISWLSQFTSDFEGGYIDADDSELSFFQKLLNKIKSWFMKIFSLFS